MGNHHAICPYCDADQRHGFPCCDAARLANDEIARAWRAEQAEIAALLRRYNISFNPSAVHGSIVVESSSVIDFLRRLERAARPPAIHLGQTRDFLRKL